LLELTAYGVAVVSGRDEHMGGERRESGGDLPHVQVVKALHVRMRLDRHEADDQSERGSSQPLRIGVRVDAVAVRVLAV
jgi:hypothetical protein